MKTFICIFLVVAAFYGFKYSGTAQQKKTETEKPSYSFDNDNPPQKVTCVPVPKTVSFAGEQVPLDKPEVKEALERELLVNTFRHSNTIRMIKNFERWRNFILKNLKASAIPEDFLYLAVVESEFDNNATSPAGAAGMWQIMEQTGKENGLLINGDADMRRDPKEATIAASKYFKCAFGTFNSWSLVAASYNVGIKGMKDRLASQKVDNYYDLHLNSETGRYLFRILALKIILENPQLYGYNISETEKYKPYTFKTVKVTDSIANLVDFAKKNNTTYKELRMLNPWFNNTTDFSLKLGKKDTVEIRLPL